MRGNPRIASLLPSATEIVCALGLGERLVGVSHECDWPEAIRALPRLTRVSIDTEADSAAIDRAVREAASALYRIDAAQIAALDPGVIVTQDHCDVCAVSLDDVNSACKTFGLDAAVVTLSPGDLASVRRDFVRVAEACGTSAGDLLRAYDRRMTAVRAAAQGRRRPRVKALEWLDPPIPAGGYLVELIELAGGTVVDRDPDLLLLVPCGYPIPKTLRELNAIGDRFAGERVFVADGNAYFNRPGPRLADSAEILGGIFGHLPLRAGAVVWP